jgi:hypothetical protein
MISPVNTMWERSMRFTDQMNDDELSPVIEPDVGQGATVPPGWAAESYNPFGGAVEAPAELDPPRSRIVAAMSWLMTAFVEGCAAYGMSMYPGLPDPSYYMDPPEPEMKTQPPQPARKQRGDREFDIWPLEDFVPSGNGRDSNWSVRILSPFVGLWARFRGQREARPAIETSEDGDFDWRQFDSSARHGDRYGP